MLLDSAAGKKAGALAASFTLQTLGVGTLLLIPLVYTDRLNFVPLYLPVVLRPIPDPLSRKGPRTRNGMKPASRRLPSRHPREFLSYPRYLRFRMMPPRQTSESERPCRCH